MKVALVYLNNYQKSGGGPPPLSGSSLHGGGARVVQTSVAERSSRLPVYCWLFGPWNSFMLMRKVTTQLHEAKPIPIRKEIFLCLVLWYWKMLLQNKLGFTGWCYPVWLQSRLMLRLLRDNRLSPLFTILVPEVEKFLILQRSYFLQSQLGLTENNTY